MDERIKQFSRLPCDDDQAWLAFTQFRNQTPPRRLYAGEWGMEQTRKWYQANCWKERVAAYDAWVDEIFLEQRRAFLAQAAKDIGVEHMMILKDLREVAMNEARKFLKTSKESEMPMVSNVGQLTKVIDTAVKLDRLIRGEVTERIGDEFDYSKLSPEELMQLQDLLSRAKLDG